MLKILLFAIGLAQIAHSTYVEKNPSCAKGPSYWCQSVAASKECNAFKHCLQAVWTKHTDYLNSDEQVVDPNNPNPNKCTNCLQCVDARVNYCPYVKDFTDEIDQLRDNKLSPSSICKLLGQCKPVQIIDHGGLIAGEDAQTDPRFKCGLHPRQHCDNLDTATQCASTASCFNQWSQSTQKYVLKPQSGDENVVDLKSQKTCGFCIFLFNKLHAALEQNDTEIDIEQYLMGACILLPTKNETEMCNEAVQKYLPDIIKMVRNNLDPGIICRVLKLCDDKFLMPIEIESPVSEEEKLKINKELREFVEAIKVRVVNEDEAVIETPLTPKKPHLLGSKDETLVATLKQSMGVGCELCQIVLSAAKHLIQNKVDDQQVLAFINKELCSRLGAYKSACQDYVNLEGEQILSLLKKAIDPALICEMMGFCLKIQTSSERLYDLDVRNGLNCTLCKMVFTEVKKKLGQHEEEERIINYINTNLCEKVGKTKEMCKTLMEQYGPLFLSIIARDINPGQVCEMIGMCSKADAVPFVDLKPATTVQSSDTCVICEFVIKLLSDYVSKNTTEPEIEKLLEMVCTKIIPTSVRPQCNQFIQQYGPAVISLIINGVKPDQVCGFIGLCPKSGSLDTSSSRFFDEETLFEHRSQELDHQPEPSLVKIDSDRKNQTLQCSLCIYVAEVVDNLLKQNKTDDQITKEIELVCNLFPGDLRGQCKSFLDEYMPYILQLVAAELDAETTCAALKLCPKSIEQDVFRRSFVNKLPTN